MRVAVGTRRTLVMGDELKDLLVRQPQELVGPDRPVVHAESIASRPRFAEVNFVVRHLVAVQPLEHRLRRVRRDQTEVPLVGSHVPGGVDDDVEPALPVFAEFLEHAGAGLHILVALVGRLEFAESAVEIQNDYVLTANHERSGEWSRRLPAPCNLSREPESAVGVVARTSGMVSVDRGLVKVTGSSAAVAIRRDSKLPPPDPAPNRKCRSSGPHAACWAAESKHRA